MRDYAKVWLMAAVAGGALVGGPFGLLYGQSIVRKACDTPDASNLCGLVPLLFHSRLCPHRSGCRGSGGHCCSNPVHGPAEGVSERIVGFSQCSCEVDGAGHMH